MLGRAVEIRFFGLGRVPIRFESQDLHRVGQSRVENSVMPDRGLAVRAVRLQPLDFARQAKGVASLRECEHAALGRQEGLGERRVARQRREQPAAEGLPSLKVIGLQIGQSLLVGLARIGIFQHLKAKESGALLRLLRRQQHGQPRHQLGARFVQDLRLHARGGAAAVLAHGHLPHVALPGEKTVPEALALRFAHCESLPPKGVLSSILAVEWAVRTMRAIMNGDFLIGKHISSWLTEPGAPPSIALRWGEFRPDDVARTGRAVKSLLVLQERKTTT